MSKKKKKVKINLPKSGFKVMVRTPEIEDLQADACAFMKECARRRALEGIMPFLGQNDSIRVMTPGRLEPDRMEMFAGPPRILTGFEMNPDVTIREVQSLCGKTKAALLGLMLTPSRLLFKEEGDPEAIKAYKAWLDSHANVWRYRPKEALENIGINLDDIVWFHDPLIACHNVDYHRHEFMRRMIVTRGKAFIVRKLDRSEDARICMSMAQQRGCHDFIREGDFGIWDVPRGQYVGYYHPVAKDEFHEFDIKRVEWIEGNAKAFVIRHRPGQFRLFAIQRVTTPMAYRFRKFQLESGDFIIYDKMVGRHVGFIRRTERDAYDIIHHPERQFKLLIPDDYERTINFEGMKLKDIAVPDGYKFGTNFPDIKSGIIYSMFNAPKQGETMEMKKLDAVLKEIDKRVDYITAEGKNLRGLVADLKGMLSTAAREAEKPSAAIVCLNGDEAEWFTRITQNLIGPTDSLKQIHLIPMAQTANEECFNKLDVWFEEHPNEISKFVWLGWMGLEKKVKELCVKYMKVGGEAYCIKTMTHNDAIAAKGPIVNEFDLGIYDILTGKLMGWVSMTPMER